MAVASAPVSVSLDGGAVDLPRCARIVTLLLPLQLAGVEHLADALGRPAEELGGLIDAVEVPCRLLPHGGIVSQQRGGETMLLREPLEAKFAEHPFYALR